MAEDLYAVAATVNGERVHLLACRHLVAGIALENWVAVFASEPCLMCPDCAGLAADLVAAAASTHPTAAATPKKETPT